MLENVLIAIITGCIAVIGSYVTAKEQHNKTISLIQYRLDLIEKKQDKHNQLIDRMVSAEKKLLIIQAKLKKIEE